MEETEILEENENTAEEASATEKEEACESGAETAVEKESESGEDSMEEAEESEETEISAEGFAKALANPMFAVFARGRSGSVESAVRDFEKMLAAGRSTLSEEELMKMTPGAYSSASGTALSERQRKIARDAGMSYREYYEIICSIPTKTK